MMLLRHYIMLLQCMTSALINGPKIMTKSINVLSNLLRDTIINSMSNNRAAKCHNVAGVSKE
jgi:hypothetical protein